MRPVFIIIAFIAIAFISCFRGTYNTLQKVSLGGADRYEIKSMAGCCGCKAILYNVIRSDKISEQFVVETNCGLFEPTKHLFTLDTEGRVTNVKSLIAATDTSFTFPLTEIDKEALIKLDSIYAYWQSVNKKRIAFADVTGFKEGENMHMHIGVKVVTSSAK